MIFICRVETRKLQDFAEQNACFETGAKLFRHTAENKTHKSLT